MDSSFGPAGPATILLVEDDDLLFSFIRRLLSRKGYDLLTSRDPAQALELAQRHEGPIHLLLSDVEMPGIRGDDLARRLVAQRPEMKVLLMSGYAEESVIGSCLPKPQAAFIEKPFEVRQLLNQIRKMLDTHA